MVYAKFGGQTECIMRNWKIENMMTGCSKNTRENLKSHREDFLWAEDVKRPSDSIKQSTGKKAALQFSFDY